jgi:hypothetical protein
MAELNVTQEDRNLRKSLGLWQLTAIGFSGVIGSGWLLGAMVAAQIAGPEAIVAWLVGGAALMLIALVMADLGAARPESGGLIRWPYYSSGRLVATIAGWGIWIAYATNPPSESAAMIQYASRYVPGIYSGSSLTTLGVLLGIGVMALFVLINWFGVLLFARINGALTVAKFVVPTLTVIALFISGFHSSNFSSHGGLPAYRLVRRRSADAAWVPALPGADAYLVALGVGQYPERGGFSVANQRAARRDGVLEALMRLVVRHRDVEMDAVTLRARLVHLLEPERRALAQRVDQPGQRPALSWLVEVAEHRLPERPHLGRVEYVDRDLEYLHRSPSRAGSILVCPRPRGQPELLRQGGDLPR